MSVEAVGSLPSPVPLPGNLIQLDPQMQVSHGPNDKYMTKFIYYSLIVMTLTSISV